MKTIVLEHQNEILAKDIQRDKMIEVWKGNDRIGQVVQYTTETLTIFMVPKNSFGKSLFAAFSLEKLIEEGIGQGYEFTID